MTYQKSEYRRRIGEKAAEQKQKAERERHEAAEQAHIDQVIASIERLGQKFDRQADENTPHKKRERRWHHAEVLGLWTAASVGVAAIWFAHGDSAEQYAAMRDQQKIIQGQLDALKLEQRPWAYVFNAVPNSDVIFNPNDQIGAFVSLSFQLKMAGKIPARFAIIGGEFLMRGGTQDEIRRGWGKCDQMRLKKPEDFLEGTAIFPDQIVTQIHGFFMSKDDIAKWQTAFDRMEAEKTPFPFAPTIVGCIDYIFDRDNVHHQTRFVYEIDKAGPEQTPFMAYDPKGGNLPKGQVGIAKNPGLADDPD